MKDRFEHILSEKLRDITVEPASRDWMAVERSLGLDVKAGKSRPLYRYAAAAAAVLLVAFIGVTVWRTEPALSPEPLLATVVPAVGVPPITDPFATDAQEKKGNEALDVVRRLKEVIDRSVASNTAPAVVQPTPQPASGSPVTVSPLQAPPSANTAGRSTGNNTYTRTPDIELPDRFVTAAHNTPRRTPRVSRTTPNGNWALSLFANGTGGSRNSNVSTERMLLALNQNNALGQSYGDPLTGNSGLSSDPSSSYLIRYDQSRSSGLLMAEVADWQHARPLGAGFRVRRGLTERWGVETGLNYTYLASKQEITSVTRKQELHYLGVPLAVTYTPLRTKSFELYGRAGGAADLNIAGRTTLQTNGVSAPAERFTDKHVQWSVSANLGVMYRITPSLGFYLEPGVSHRFEFAGQPDSYWKQHPTGFDVQVGFRTDF